jgi:UDP-GlcNAc:undecaprenyl-phosphate GlcNAc-1-phosphate transferase
LVMTPMVRRVCQRFRWLDHPRGGRKIHQRAVPRLGGVAIFAAVLIAVSTLPFIDNLLTQELRQNSARFILALGCAALVLLLGVYDDFYGANATVKFVALSAIGTLFYALGGRIDAISVPFVGSVALPNFLGFAFTLLWVVGIANAFNLIDGIDGLAAGTALFSSLVILVVSLMKPNPVVILLAVALSRALIGFLRYNFNPPPSFWAIPGRSLLGFCSPPWPWNARKRHRRPWQSPFPLPRLDCRSSIPASRLYEDSLVAGLFFRAIASTFTTCYWLGAGRSVEWFWFSTRSALYSGCSR